MARGWGRSEEDLGAEKEHAKEARRAASGGAKLEAKTRAEAHSIRLSLARIEDQLENGHEPRAPPRPRDRPRRAPDAAVGARAESAGGLGFVKIATWNVNGIRARQAQVQDWIERERPDVVCLQEIKASSRSGAGRPSARWRATGATGTAARATPASRSTSARTFAPERPAFTHPDVRLREPHRDVADRRLRRASTVASIYVPNGGKDFPAKMRVPRGAGAVRGGACAGRRPRSCSAAT